MPYITEDDRFNIDLALLNWVSEQLDRDQKTDEITLKGFFEDLFVCNVPVKPGELNYIITTLIHCYTKRKGLRYATFNEVMGILSCASSEFYRCVIAPYEDKKVKENGCISELDDDSTFG